MAKQKKIKTIKVWSSKKKKVVKTIYNICIVILSLVFLGCVVYLGNYFWQSKKSEDKVDELRDLIVEVESTTEKPSSVLNDSKDKNDKEKKPEYVKIDGKNIQKKYEKLYRKNTDFVGWINISGTVIDYPVMQTPGNEEYYIDRDFDKEYSSAGTLFVDTQCNLESDNDNIIMYGHNMKTGKMFHMLLEYESEDFYKQHKTFTFNTIYDDNTYEVIAAFRTKIFDVDYTGFKYYKFFDARNQSEFDEYVSNCRALTPYYIEESAKYGDELLTLSTCAYHDDNGRYVVVAKKVN